MAVHGFNLKLGKNVDNPDLGSYMGWPFDNGVKTNGEVLWNDVRLQCELFEQIKAAVDLALVGVSALSWPMAKIGGPTSSRRHLLMSPVKGYSRIFSC